MLNPKNIYQLINHVLVFGCQGNRHLWTSFPDTPHQNNCTWNTGEQPARPLPHPPCLHFGAQQWPDDCPQDPGTPPGLQGIPRFRARSPTRRSLFPAGAPRTSTLAPSRQVSWRLYLSAHSLPSDPTLRPLSSKFSTHNSRRNWWQPQDALASNDNDVIPDVIPLTWERKLPRHRDFWPIGT